MDKRYQVFVSSTYEDLQEERQEVMHALLVLYSIPFKVSNFSPPQTRINGLLSRRSLMITIINIVLVLGGRYGSVDKDGVSYTEKEYRYALEKGETSDWVKTGGPG